MADRVCVLPLARGTFDTDFAEEKRVAMMACLSAQGHSLLAPDRMLMDGTEAEQALAEAIEAGADRILILQLTFTDAAFVGDLGDRLSVPLSIWAVPEPRLGGRLRLNSFCGLNLASHALGLRGVSFGWLFADPEKATDAEVSALFAEPAPRGGATALSHPTATADGQAVAQALAGRRILRIGAHPDGFDTCRYDAAALKALSGVTVETRELPELFASAAAQPDAAADALRAETAAQVTGTEDVDAAELDRSLRLKLALDTLRRDSGADAFALRCWPETFTEYGGAICGPASLMGEARVPCACEADVYGALTQLLLQEAADAPVFLTDIVDADMADNSLVLWHCGQAPASMAATSPAAGIHSNRKMPLLMEFALKPGPVTLARVSQGQGKAKLVLAQGEMLARPLAFSGTAGVVRFERPAADIVDDIISSGLEHHVALAYGDHRARLRAAAGALDLPVLEI